MPLKRDLQARRTTVAAVILLAGLGAGLLIFLTASPSSGDLLGDQANQSKQYQREMETYGGTANLLASEIREWFDGLWHGRTLGVTVACLSALLAVAVFLALTPLPPSLDGARAAQPPNGRQPDDPES
jgi:hypothetical protein